MSQQRTLIRNATVVTMDDELGDLDRADILVEGSKIAAVAPDLGVQDAEVLNADGVIVVPGFVNTHLHTWQHALRGVCADWTVKGYVRCWRVHLHAGTLQIHHEAISHSIFVHRMARADTRTWFEAGFGLDGDISLGKLRDAQCFA